MMKVYIEFDLGDKVEINELEKIGKIISVWITEHGIKYEVRYFDKVEAKTVYFFVDELKPMKGKNGIGFQTEKKPDENIKPPEFEGSTQGWDPDVPNPPGMPGPETRKSA